MGEMADYYDQGYDYDNDDERSDGTYCRYCGNGPFQWFQTAGRWRLSTSRGRVHVCKAHPATRRKKAVTNTRTSDTSILAERDRLRAELDALEDKLANELRAAAWKALEVPVDEMSDMTLGEMADHFQQRGCYATASRLRMAMAIANGQVPLPEKR